jgi:prevent-host-death family protein
MQTFAAKKAKDSFGLLLDTAQHEPVFISKKNRLVAVVLSKQEYERFLREENALLAIQADKAKKSGFIGKKASENILSELLNAKT